MAGEQRYLLNRDGRFFARLVVPKDLRAAVGKSELRAPLGPDRRTAMKLLPGAVAQLQHHIAQAERQSAPARVADAPARYPLAPDQIALSHYHQRLAFDDELRNDVAAAATPIIFGDFKACYRIYDRVALDVMPDLLTQRITGLARFHARRRVGAGVVRTDVFRKLKMAA